MTAKLILSLNGTVLKEYQLNKERISIGRKPTNDIAIDNLAVSGEHALVETFQSDSFLEDLNSTNGVIVNGVEIKRHFLQHNDVIEIGRHTLVYINEQQVPSNNMEKTVLVRSSPRMAKAMAEESADVASPRTMRGDEGSASAPQFQHNETQLVSVQQSAVVQVLNGPRFGKKLPLTKTLTTLGKPGVQVAVIARRPHGFFITHVEGEKFPLLNGQSLNDQPHLLHDHDVIELAGVKMEFYFEDGEA